MLPRWRARTESSNYMKRLRRRSLAAGLVAIPGLILLASPALSQTPNPVPVDDSSEVPVSEDLVGAVGTVQIVVQLDTAPLADVVPADATSAGRLPGAADQQAHLAAVNAEQDAVAPALASVGATELASVDTSLNAVVVSVDASQLDAIAAIPQVKSVQRVHDYTLFQEPAVESGSLAQAAQYIGADVVRDAGFDGAGVRVAVLDSGIDFTHSNLGGPGTGGFYEQCYGDPEHPENPANPANRAPEGRCADLFGQTAPKVKGGVDFIGENWPKAAAAPDPNPIDFQGHGTHVSDIIAGRSADGTHLGIAPGAELYALKVCSAVATSCSGIGLLQAVDWALDPDGDGDISDAVDLMNLSLGSDYGQVQDDLTQALTNAAELGVVVVTSAGNGADRAYKVGSPSISPQVLSVAQTTLPDDRWIPITIVSPVIAGIPGNVIKNAVEQPWAPLFIDALTAPAARPSVSVLGCTLADYGSGFPAGAIAVVQRGSCNVSLKSDAARQAGAAAVIIVNNAGGLAPTFSFGGGEPIRTLVTNKPFGDQLLAAIAAGPVTLTLDPASAITLTNTMVASSSRGPTIDGSLAKPDIGAPGAWLSAEVGTGSEVTNFGGTSGAAPTVSGSAVLLLDKYDGFPPSRLTSMLVNSADTGNTTPKVDGSFYATPISRIGGGEVRVDRAADIGLVARNKTSSISLSFGAVDAPSPKVLSKKVILRNLESTRKTYTITPTFRYADDEANGAVRPAAPKTVTVPPFGTAEFTVTLVINANSLPDWPFAGLAGSSGNGEILNGPEYDGFINLVSGDDEIHLPWHVLPRKASALKSAASVTLNTKGTAKYKVRNLSFSAAGTMDVFSLTGTSDDLPDPGAGDPGSPGSNAAVVDLAAVGARNDSEVVQFAISTYGRRAVPLYPALFEVDIDTDGDGEVDFFVFNRENGGFGATGQDVVFVQQVGSPTARGFFFSIADFNSSNTIFTVPLSALGVTEGSTLDYSVIAIDNNFTGEVTDVSDGNTYTIDAPRYVVAEGFELTVPANGKVRFTVQATGSPAPSSETGLLFLKTADALGDFQTVSVSGGVVPFRVPAN
jgi:Subtilase family/PA domain